MELVQGFPPLPQEGADTMLQLLDPLPEKPGSRHSFLAAHTHPPGPGRLFPRAVSMWDARVFPGQGDITSARSSTGLDDPPWPPARTEIWWGSVTSAGIIAPGSLRSRKPCLLLVPAPRNPALPASAGIFQGPSDLQTNNPSLRIAIVAFSQHILLLKAPASQ